MPVLEVGHKFERYQVVRHLGNGISGTSYEAEDMLLRRKVTLKLIHPWAVLPDSARRQFFRDMQSISLLAHPHQAAVLDYGEADGQLYIVRRYVSAGSLLSNEGRAWFSPPLPVASAFAYTYQLAQALHNIHRYNHIHGSLTLSNILVLRNAGSSHEKEVAPFLLTDIGMAHFVRRFGQPKIARLPVTAAPEQARGRITPASDQYALAAILYFWLAGRPPFFGSPEEIEQAKRSANFPVLTSQNPQVTLEQEGIIRRALSAYPEERYPGTLAFAETLRTSLTHAVPPAVPAGWAKDIITEPLANSPAIISAVTIEPSEIVEVSPAMPEIPSQAEPVSTTFLMDKDTLRRLTELAKEEVEPELVKPSATMTSSFDDEPVTSTFLIKPDTLDQLTALAQQESSEEKTPKPLQPQIDPIAPQPHPEPVPIPKPEPEKPTPPAKPEPPLEPEVIPTPAPDIAQPLPDTSPPPEIAQPVPEKTPEIPLPEREQTKSKPKEADDSKPAGAQPVQKGQEGFPTTDTLPIISEQLSLKVGLLSISSPYVDDKYEYMLTRDKTTLGRAGSSDILLDQDPQTSRRHAYIQREGTALVLYDDDSTLGVIVNGQKLVSQKGHMLADGDYIRIGEYKLLFRWRGMVEVEESEEAREAGAAEERVQL